MPQITFNLNKWQALSPGLADLDRWKTWAELDMTWPQNPNAAPADLIPAMMRRRTSSLSKLALQTAISLTEDQNIDYIIFSSRHGELTRTVKLLEALLQGEEASPTMFSQTVHNTAAGLFTIATKRATPVTSLASGENTFHCALIEAAAYLSEHPGHQVLLVDFDEPLPAPYSDFDHGTYQGYALGMLLTGGTDYQLSWESRPYPAPSPNPQTLTVIRHLAQETPAWSLGTEHRCWHWQRITKQ